MDTLKEYLKIKAMPFQERQNYFNSCLNSLKGEDYFKNLVELFKIFFTIHDEERAASFEHFLRIKRDHEMRCEVWQKFKTRYLQRKKDDSEDDADNKCRILPLFPKQPKGKR